MNNDTNAFRDAAQNFQIWVNQLKGEGDTCISEIADLIESPTDPPSSAVDTQASFAVDRLERRIRDVMGSYDALLRVLGQEPRFDDPDAEGAEQ